MSDSNEVVTDPRLEKRTRRRFNVAEKKRLLAEVDALGHGDKGAWLRRKGLYADQLSNWRKELAEHGEAGLARHMFSEVLNRRQIATEGLIVHHVHQDRGSPMIAHSFAKLLSGMGVEQSFSRPRVCNDNAFSESQFKTTKYWPSYPGRFRDKDHARQWCQVFFPAYNRRPHEGLALFTPDDVYTGQVEMVWQIGQAAMDRHYADHPERYVPVGKKLTRSGEWPQPELNKALF